MTTETLEVALMGRLKKNAVRIPPYPAVATKLRKLAEGTHVSLDQLAMVLSSDPSRAALVIRRASTAANGACFITTLPAAISRLGIEELIGLALAADLGRAAVVGGPLSPLRRDAWRCALLSARIAQELAPARDLSPDEAHLAGLLHDFGAVVVIATIEDLGRETPLPQLPPVEWIQLIEKLHVEFGLITALRWGLPETLMDVIEHHQAPTTPLARLIYVVDQVVAALDRAPAAGLATLLDVREISTEERARIATALPQVVEQMASFAPPTTQFVPVVLPLMADGEPAWPIDVAIEMKGGRFRATRLSPSAITFHGPSSLALNWLTELTLQTDRGPLVLLANVKRCDRVKSGGFAITAQPFALAGPGKAAWAVLVESARATSRASIVGTTDHLPRLSL